MSCDNMTGNGDATRRCVLDAARRRDGSLADWITSACTFPNSMVDRITPATTDHDRSYLVATYGLRDEWPVVSEPFRQWVIEDDFAVGRPAGIVHIDEALCVAELRDFLTAFLLDEAAPTLEQIPGHPPQQYVVDVLDRFANTGIRDQIARICTDSTAKFETFVMPILTDQLERDGSIDRIAHALAAWTHYLTTTPAEGQPPDSSGDIVRSLAHASIANPGAFLDERAGFPSRATGDTRLTTAYTSAHQAIATHGSLGALRQLALRPTSLDDIRSV